MLESAHIKNIQLIKDEALTFHPLINIVSGESDNGKSALFRSLTLAISNTPSAYEYKPHNLERGGISSSELTFNNCTIERKRSASINQYVCDKFDKPLEAFGNNVPPQLKELMLIPDYMVQTQHSPYFLLNDSPGEVAKKINSVCDLEIIDKSQSKIESIVTKSKSDLSYTKETLKEKNVELETLDFVEGFEEQVKAIEKLIEEDEKLSSDIEKVSAIIESIEALSSEIKSLDAKIIFETKIKEVLQLIQEHVKIDKDCDEIEKIVNRIEVLNIEIGNDDKKLRNEPSIKALINKIEEYKREEVKCSKVSSLLEAMNYEESEFNKLNFVGRINDLVLKITEFKKVNKEISVLENIVENIEVLNEELEEIEERLNISKLKLQEYKETLGQCPFCGNELQ